MRRALLLLVALGACASPQPAPKRPASHAVVPLAELPAEYRSAWEAWLAGGAEWERQREFVIRDPKLAQFVVDNLFRTLVANYDASRLAGVGAEPGPFERAQVDLVRLQEHSLPLLAALLEVEDGVVAFLAADRLAAIGAPAISAVVERLGASRDETRRRAAELLGRLPHAGAAETSVEEALAARVSGDPAWTVRAEAATALGARGARHVHKGYARGVLTRALGDPDPAVGRGAIAGLERLAEPSAVPAVARAMDQAARAGDPRRARELEALLRKLSGDPRPRTAAEWAAWWADRERRSHP